MRSLLLCLCLAAGMGGLAGCAPGYPETARVSGTITLNGRPLNTGEIQFISTTGMIAYGRVQPDGSYRLTSFQPDDGAVPGKHQVIIRPIPTHQTYGMVGLIAIPDRYADPNTSGLTAEVNPGINSIPFELTTDDQTTEGADSF